MKVFSLTIILEAGQDFRNVVQSALGELNLDDLNELQVDENIQLTQAVSVNRHE